MLVLGIDEAGRGSFIGDLVISGVLIEEEKENILKKIGCKDSKQLSAKKREELKEKIKEVARDFHTINISAYEIDKMNYSGINLNLLEAMKIAEIINKLKPDKVILDSPSGTKKFVNNVKARLEHECEIIAEFKADMNYPIVSAASILAKTERDRILKEIEKKIGVNLGVGYPHDEKMRENIKPLIRNPEIKKYLRHTWSTYNDLLNEKEQKNLGEF